MNGRCGAPPEAHPGPPAQTMAARAHPGAASVEQVLGLREEGLRLRVEKLEVRVEGLWSKVSDWGLRVEGLGFSV